MSPRKSAPRISLLAVTFLGLLSTTTAAQVQSVGTIAGVVRDATGSVLPGVTVEASSPALIEKVRAAVTDAQGQYRIVDLRPGIYVVTFTLAGFQSLRRDGIVLSAGFTAPVNAELMLGSIEETITVSGESPLVDIYSTTETHTLKEDIIDALPTSRNFVTVAVLVPGMVLTGTGSGGTQDVGGNTAGKNNLATFHGSSHWDMPILFDGMNFANAWSTGGGPANTWVANSGIVEEITITTSGAGADTATSGVQINQIPRQGGNMFSGLFFAAYTNDRFQANNFDESLRARGALNPTRTKKIWDINPALGGPIKEDKLWFFFSYGNWGTREHVPGAYHDTNPSDFVFTPDLTRPALGGVLSKAWNLRLTWQVSRTSKLALYGDHLANYVYHNNMSALQAYEAAPTRITPLNHGYIANWNWTASSRLLVEVAQLYLPQIFRYPAPPEAAADSIGVRDIGTGQLFRAPLARHVGVGGANWDSLSHIWNGRASASYVTGSHTLKVGSNWTNGFRIRTNKGDTTYTLVNGVPNLVNYTTDPSPGTDNLKLNLGLYVQEQWTRKRLTLNLGARFDYVNAYTPVQHLPATKWVGPRDFPAQLNQPNWKDLSPRLGASYDLFGNGKTALKWNLGRYLEGISVNITEVTNPVLSRDSAFTTRAWNDVNGDFIPQESELSASSNTNFGTSYVNNRYAPNTVTGWGRRGWNWETMVGVQHELRPGLSVNAGYYWRTLGNFRITDNALVTPADYDPFCVTSPIDQRLLDGGGTLVCGLYNITPTLFGKSDNVISLDKTFGKRTEMFDGIDVTVNGRLPGGVTFQGGTSTGRVKTNSCFVIDSPEALRFCDVKPPFQTQIKFLGTYPLPWWGLQFSATYQSLPGPQITAAWAAPPAAVSGLGRPLAGGQRSVTVELVAPGTMYGERLHQVDVRFIKNLRVNRLSLQPQFDLYNLFNVNTVLTLNTTYGPRWQAPQRVLAGRLAKFSVMLKF